MFVFVCARTPCSPPRPPEKVTCTHEHANAYAGSNRAEVWRRAHRSSHEDPCSKSGHGLFLIRSLPLIPSPNPQVSFIPPHSFSPSLSLSHLPSPRILPLSSPSLSVSLRSLSLTRCPLLSSPTPTPTVLVLSYVVLPRCLVCSHVFCRVYMTNNMTKERHSSLDISAVTWFTARLS